MSGRNGCTWGPFEVAAVPSWADGVSIGNRPITADWQETSGMCRTQKSANAGHIWCQSDGTINKIFAVRTSDCATRGEWTLTAATPSDLEDIASATVGGQPYIYLADTGNNANAADSRGAGVDLRIYRIKEPTIDGNNGTLTGGGVDYETIACAFPGGDVPSHRDAECLLVDPSTGDMYIITKRITPAKMYKLAHAASYTGTQTLEDVGDIWTGPLTQNATGSNGGYVVGGDISDDGKLIVILSYTKAYSSQRPTGMTIYEALAVQGNEVLAMDEPPYWRPTMPTPHTDNPQREAICFDSSGNLYLASEYLAANGHGASNHPIFRFDKQSGYLQEAAFQDGVAPTAGYAGTLDTYIWRDSGTPANETTVRGTEATFVCDYDSATVQRFGLLKFDLSSIPSTAVVQGGELQLYINTEGLANQLYKIIGFTWDENTTYSSLGLGRLPAFDGVDCASTPDVGYTGWSAALIGAGVGAALGLCRLKIPAATLQDWITTPANNRGFVVYGTTDANGTQFRSRQAATAADRPRLTVRYTLP